MRLALLLALAGCSPEPEPVAIRPTLACSEAIHCKVYQWSVGFPRFVGGAEIAGTHIRCHCYHHQGEG